MNTPLEWIKAYVPDMDVTPKEYTDAMTLSGSKVEGYERLDQDVEKVVVGQIESIERHPDADKLIVCQVNIGDKKVQIVTGATNVNEGDVIPVVLEGGRVAGSHDGKKAEGGIKIKKGKLRGVESFGMMCSVEELGTTHDMVPDSPEDGIYIFNGDIPPLGSNAMEAMGLTDVVFEYEITSNRVDCFGMLGLAREAAATFQKKFVPPVVEVKECGGDVNEYISVEVKDEDLCPRFCARVVKNVKIGPSPKWMQQRLAASGIRPINNLVDITNYVMEEYGQPMHAYDISTIAGNKIVVRRGEEGEEFQTLDGQLRKLDHTMLMICDAEKPVGIAGIMGGENSKVTDEIKTVLFEAATFDGTNVRLTSKKLGLRTDASGKFEKGLDPNNAIEAANRACQLMVELGAGEVVSGIVDVYPHPVTERTIPFQWEKVNELLGTEMTQGDMEDYFKRLELKYDKESNQVTVPTFRQDLECFADLVEEAARFYGYDNIPTTLPGGKTTGKVSYKKRIEAAARAVAEQCGFSEAMSYSFESPKVFEKLLLLPDDVLRKAVTITNPLGEDYSVMRTSPINGMLTSLSTNFNRRNKAAKLYELANTYLPKQLPVTELPDERIQFTLGMYGDGDFYHMKGVVEELFFKLGIKQRITYDPNGNKSFLHPGRQALIQCKGQTFGYLGEIHPETADNYNIGEKVYVAVLDMPLLTEKSTFDRKFEGVAKFPAVSRDISMVVKKEILAAQIEDKIRKEGGHLLESCQLFDLYEGEQIKEGCKSVAYSISFRAKDKTLTDNDVNPLMDKIVKSLEELGAELRKV